MRVLDIGIIGSGAIAKVHANCVQFFDKTNLVGIVCTDPLRSKQLEEDFNCIVYNNEETLLEQSLDAVIVCNESGKHGQSIIRAANAQKHILCEKPLEVTPLKITSLMEIINEKKIILGVIFQNRTHPEYIKFKKTFNQGIIGTPLLVQTQINWFRDAHYYKNNPWRGTLELDGGAALMNQGIHTVDLLLDLFGDTEYIAGSVSTKVHAIEGEDVAVAHFKFKNGVLGTLSGGTALYPGFPERIEIYGTKGRMVYEAGMIVEAPNEKLISINKAPKNNSNMTAKIKDQFLHLNVLEDFVDAICKNKEPLVTGKSAKKSVDFITQIYRSSKINSIKKI